MEPNTRTGIEAQQSSRPEVGLLHIRINKGLLTEVRTAAALRGENLTEFAIAALLARIAATTDETVQQIRAAEFERYDHMRAIEEQYR